MFSLPLSLHSRNLTFPTWPFPSISTCTLTYTPPHPRHTSSYISLTHTHSHYHHRFHTRARAHWQGHHGDEGASRANVVLPGAAFTEKYVTLLCHRKSCDFRSVSCHYPSLQIFTDPVAKIWACPRSFFPFSRVFAVLVHPQFLLCVCSPAVTVLVHPSLLSLSTRVSFSCPVGVPHLIFISQSPFLFISPLPQSLLAQ
jgi:hypothetical protein